MKRYRLASNDDKPLLCVKCGNDERFVEVMALETHLVNSHKDYIRLLDGIADRYLCWNCGATVQSAGSNRL